MILLVDDDPTSLRLLEMTLRREHRWVVAVTGAREALDLMKSDPGVDLVIADIRMPDMTGLEFLEQIRRIPALRWTPVIMCTSAGDSETVREAVHQGARDYILKPIRPDVVLTKVENILGATTSVMEPRAMTMERLRLTEPQYRALAKTTLEQLDTIARELWIAWTGGAIDQVEAIAERAAEPAILFKAESYLTALESFRTAVREPGSPTTVRLGETLTAFRTALARVSRPPI
jgi:CheY-like chemotaxis protein